ncbi:MAG: hypothetical protein WDO73_36985 [Ignavibacteriota bacterium]
MQDLSKDGAKIVCVAFPPQGGNSWSVVNDKGAFFNRNIPDECHQKMQDLSQGGAKIVCVAFPPQGGNTWSVVNDQGGSSIAGLRTRLTCTWAFTPRCMARCASWRSTRMATAGR